MDTDEGQQPGQAPPLPPVAVGVPMLEPYPIPGLGPVPDLLRRDDDDRPDSCFVCDMIGAGAREDSTVQALLAFIENCAEVMDHRLLFQRASEYLDKRRGSMLAYRTSPQMLVDHVTKHGPLPGVLRARNLLAVNEMLDVFFRRGLQSAEGEPVPPSKDAVEVLVKLVKLQEELLQKRGRAAAYVKQAARPRAG